jgi:hypothetical protein
MLIELGLHIPRKRNTSVRRIRQFCKYSVSVPINSGLSLSGVRLCCKLDRHMAMWILQPCGSLTNWPDSRQTLPSGR